MTSAPAIAFEYQPSTRLRRLLLGVAALALVATGLSALSWWAKAPLMVLVLATTWHTWQHLRHFPALAVGWGTDGQWTLRFAAGDPAAATLLSFRVLGGGVLLRLAVPGRRPQSLVLATDNSDAGLRRRLCMRLATVQPEDAVPRI